MAPHSKITGIFCANLFLSGTGFAATAPFRAIVGVEALGLSNAAYGLVMALSAIGGAGASVVLGALSDRISDRRILVLICSALGAVGFSLVYLFPNAFAYILAFCLLIPFGTTLFSQSFSYARAYYDSRQTTRAEFMMSKLRSMFTLAWVIVPPIAGWLASTTSAFSVFALAAGAHVISTLLIGLLMREPAAAVGTGQKKASAPDLPKAQFTPGHRTGIIGVTLIKIAMALHVTALPLIIMRDHGGSLAQVGLNASLLAALEIPCMIGWGYAAMRVSKESILLINGLIFAAYMLLVVFARSVTDIFLLQGLNAIATAALMSITISYMQDAIRGRVGLSTSLMDVVTVTSYLAASTLFAVNTSLTYSWLFGAGAALSLAGSLLIAWAGRRASLALQSR